MKQPRIMRNPNGGILNVDVSCLHSGLCQCRATAEEALFGQVTEADMKNALEQIAATARRTLHEIEEHEMLNEVESLL